MTKNRKEEKESGKNEEREKKKKKELRGRRKEKVEDELFLLFNTFFLYNEKDDSSNTFLEFPFSSSLSLSSLSPYSLFLLSLPKSSYSRKDSTSVL